MNVPDVIDQGTSFNISLSEDERNAENGLQPLVMIPADSLDREHG